MASEITQENLDKLVYSLQLDMLEPSPTSREISRLSEVIDLVNKYFKTDYESGWQRINKSFNSNNKAPYKKK